MTTEPIIRYPVTERQREMCRVAQSAPEFTELAEIREMGAMLLLQRRRDEDAVVVTAPEPGNIWGQLPLLDWDDDEGA
jgi:hypothetical protein